MTYLLIIAKLTLLISKGLLKTRFFNPYFCNKLLYILHFIVLCFVVLRGSCIMRHINVLYYYLLSRCYNICISIMHSSTASYKTEMTEDEDVAEGVTSRVGEKNPLKKNSSNSLYSVAFYSLDCFIMAVSVRIPVYPFTI